MEPPEVLLLAIGALERLRIEYFVTGSIASSSYGDPRATMDADVVVRLSEWQARNLCEAFPEEGFYISPEAAAAAARAGQGQFNLIHAESSFKIDFMVAGEDQLSESRFARARQRKLEAGATAAFASPEDVILSKLQFYREGGSDKHISDIRGILRVSGADLDRDYIERWAARLGVQSHWRKASEGL